MIQNSAYSVHSNSPSGLIAPLSPSRQLLLARTAAAQESRAVLASLPPSVLRETLRPGTEFWSGEKTLRFLAETDYFREEGDQTGPAQWPDMLLKMTKDGKLLERIARASDRGRIFSYLRKQFG